MRIIDLRPRTGLRAAGALALGLALTACSFNPYDNSNPDDLLPFRDGTPFSAPTSTDRSLVFERPGVFAAFHGTTCAVSDRSGEEIALRVQEELPLPRELDRGTVLLNGFRLKYLDEDHHVKGLGTGIGAIELVDGTLRWEAGGVLSDNDFDDGYEWCYTFTALAWSSKELQATVSHRDTNHAFRNLPWTDRHGAGAGAGLPREPRLGGAPGGRRRCRAASPTSGWARTTTSSRSPTSTTRATSTSRRKKKYGNGNIPAAFSQAGTGFVSWESIGFLKDNDTRRDQYVLDLVSGLGGPDVDLISPPFSVAPREDTGVGCGSAERHRALRGPHGLRRALRVRRPGARRLGPRLRLRRRARHRGRRRDPVLELGARPSPAVSCGTPWRPSCGTRTAFPDFYDHTQVKILGFRRITPQKPR